jgi:hypothetical protein
VSNDLYFVTLETQKTRTRLEGSSNEVSFVLVVIVEHSPKRLYNRFLNEEGVVSVTGEVYDIC